MVDSRQFIYVPRWAKVLSLTILTVLTLASFAISLHFSINDDPGNPKYADWVLMGLAVAHITLSGLAIALVLFFSEREMGVDLLRKKVEVFLTEEAPIALQRVTPGYAERATRTAVEVCGRTDIFGACYRLTNGDRTAKVWIGLNVWRVFAIYWVRLRPGQDLEAIRSIFRFPFGGAEEVGYKAKFEPANVEGDGEIVSIWLTADAPETLLATPAQRLFWLQDLAMMTESFWRTALRNGVQIADHDPSPL